MKSIEHSSESFEIELIVVQYKEKNVRKNLDDFNLRFQLITLDLEIPFYRFSLSDVLYYGFSVSSGEIIVYTTCDVVITPRLLEDIRNAILPEGIVIPNPYPEMPFGADEDDSSLYELDDPTTTGIDIFAFSRNARDVFMAHDYFSRHRFLGWGMFDHLIVAGCLKQGIPITNISAVNSTIKYHNDRAQNSETLAWLNTCHAYNVIQFRKYIGFNLRLLTLLTLNGVHESIRTNRAPNLKYMSRQGLSMVKTHFLTLITESKLFLRLLHLLPKG